MGGTGLAIALLVLVAAGAIVQAIRGLGEARQLPPPAGDDPIFFEGRCDRCGEDTSVSLHGGGKVRACLNCFLWVLGEGRDLRHPNLPEGVIMGGCPVCRASAPVARDALGRWRCERCAR